MDRFFRGIGNRIRGVRDEEAAAGDGREAAADQDMTSEDSSQDDGNVIASAATAEAAAGEASDGDSGTVDGTDGDAGDEPLNQDTPPAGGGADASGGGLDPSTARPILQPTEADGFPGYVLRPSASAAEAESEDAALDPGSEDDDAVAGTDDATTETGSRREPVTVNETEGDVILQTTEDYLASQGASDDAGEDAESESGGDVYLEPPPGAADNQETDEQPRDENGEAGDGGNGGVTVVWDDSSDSASDSVIISVGTGGSSTSGGEEPEPEPDETITIVVGDPEPVGTDVVTGNPVVFPDQRTAIRDFDFSTIVPRMPGDEEAPDSISVSEALRRGILSAEDLQVKTNADAAGNLPRNLNLAQDDEDDDDDELIPAFLQDRIEIPEIKNEPEPGTGPPNPQPKVEFQIPQAEIVRSTLDLERAPTGVRPDAGGLDVMNSNVMAGDSEAGEPMRVIDPSRLVDPVASGDPDLGPPMRVETLAGTAPDTAQPIGPEALAGTAPDTFQPVVGDVGAKIDFQETLVQPPDVEPVLPSAIEPPQFITPVVAEMPADPLPADDSGSVSGVEPMEIVEPIEDGDDDPDDM